MKKIKNNWFIGEIEKDEEYIVSITFDLVNKTVNVGKLKGIELPDGTIRFKASGSVDVIPIEEFSEEFSDFSAAILIKIKTKVETEDNNA